MQTEVMDLLEQRAVFLGSSDNLHASDKVIIGLPMDATTSFRPGTRLAPYRIREVSEVIEEYSVYLDKSLADACYYDAGDVLIPWGNVNESLKRIEKVAHHFLSQDKRLFAIGGEHLVTLPLVKAYKEFYPDLAVIQMDAGMGFLTSSSSLSRYIFL
jgi:agmatinase